MAKTYYLTFGTGGDPRTFPGLAPTFLTFSNNGSAVTPPSIGAVAGATGFYSFTWGTTTPIAFLVDAATTSPGTSGRYVIGAIDPNDRGDEYGNTMIATGSTGVALGQTGVAIGINLGTSFLAFGLTSVALGNSGYAIGLTSIALVGNMGSTLVGVGNTLSSLGISLTAQSATFLGLLGTPASSIGSTGIDPTSVFGFLMRAQEITEGNQTYTKSTGILDLFTRGATLLREKTISDTSSQTTKT